MLLMGAPTPGPGWYPDPSGNGGQRYWDGAKWSEFRAAAHTPTSKGRMWLIFGVVFVVLIGAFALLNAMSKVNAGDGHTPGTGGGSSATAAQTAGLNQPVRDGKFEFIVRSVTAARGYTVVTITVGNIGNEAQTFFPQNQKLIDSAGREYDCDTMAVYEFNRDGIVELNPGLNQSVAVPFQAAPGTQFVAVEWHDSAFSGGARVSLG